MTLFIAATQMAKTLSYADTWLDEAVAYAAERGSDPELLLAMQLHPEMYPLMLQLQSAADAVKFAFARLGGKEAPVHADDEESLADIRARLASIAEYVATFSEEDFEGAEGRMLTLSFLPEGKVLRADRYLYEMAQPNFYFHVTTAYGILRQAGVKLGKRRFIQTLSIEDAES